jgi:cytochrome c-type biogenesis protein CcmF
MIVHLGVVVIAVALAAATSFAHRTEVSLRPGSQAIVDGHRITYEGLTQVRTPAKDATEALVLVDGHGPWHPAVSQFGAGTEPVTTPAIDSGFFEDVYLTVDSLPNTAGGTVGIGVIVQPLVAWLWAGGTILVLGALLAAVPDRRRRSAGSASGPARPAAPAGQVREAAAGELEEPADELVGTRAP